MNPNDGVVITDGSLNPDSPSVTGAAYANNFSGSTSTTLFVLDHQTGFLYIQSPPNAGTISFVGSTGVAFNSNTGFDIGSYSNKLFAILSTTMETALYEINSSTGQATKLRDMPMGSSAFTVGTGF